MPEGLDGVHMWVKSGGKEVLKKVGVWVICCGIQADGPMRQLLNRCLGHAAERGCDCCGILSKKGVWNANKFLGCVAAPRRWLSVHAISPETSASFSPRRHQGGSVL